MRKAIALSAASAAILAVIACKNDRPVSTTSTTGARTLSADDAVAHLTARRCDHEVDCKNVGSGKRYDDRGGCERELSHDLESQLGQSACTHGVREDRLTECMAAIRAESCATVTATSSTNAPCRTSALCVP